MSDQWGAAQPLQDPQPEGRGCRYSQQQAPSFGSSGQRPQNGQELQQFGAAGSNQMQQLQQSQQPTPLPVPPSQQQPGPQFDASVPGQSGGRQPYPYGQSQSQSQSTLGTPGQFEAQPLYGVSGQGQGYGLGQGQGESQGQSFGRQPESGYGVGPGYGPDPYAGAYAGAPYGGAVARQTNGLALAGAILSVVPLLGLVFSIIGLNRAKVLGGAGKTAAAVGIVLSLVFAGAYGFGIYELADSTAADSACSSYESAFTAMESKLNADESALSRAESSNDVSSVRTTLAAMVSDMQAIKGEFDSYVTKAPRADWKVKLQAIDADLGRVIRDLKAVETGDQTAASDLQSVAALLSSEGKAAGSLCGNVTSHQ